MNPQPLITKIVPTFRRPRLLKRALASVLKQTYPHFQVCVYDNASGDETGEVVKAFQRNDSRVKYHCHPENIGMMGNYEYAFKEVQTPYFSVLSDDDLLFPWFFEEMLKELEQHPAAAFCAGSAIIMSEKGKVIRVPLDLWPREGCYPPQEGTLEMISKYPVPMCILFRSSVLQEFPIDKNNALTWDCDFLLQIASRHPILIKKRPCGIFLSHEASYSKAQDYTKWECSYSLLQNRVAANADLADSIREKAVQAIELGMRQTARACIILSLFDKQFKDAATHSAHFRNRYGMNSTSLSLTVLSNLCRIFPLMLYALRVLRYLKRLGKKEAQYAYEEYAAWLKDSS